MRRPSLVSGPVVGPHVGLSYAPGSVVDLEREPLSVGRKHKIVPRRGHAAQGRPPLVGCNPVDGALNAPGVAGEVSINDPVSVTSSCELPDPGFPVTPSKTTAASPRTSSRSASKAAARNVDPVT